MDNVDFFKINFQGHHEGQVIVREWVFVQLI